MKKIIILVLSIFLLFSCNDFKSKKQQRKTATIGVILPLTGNYAKIGKDIKASIEIAYKDAVKNNIISDNIVKLAFEDNQIDASKTVTAYNKLKSTNNLIAVVTVTSKCLLALKPMVNKDKIILLNGSAVSPEINDSSDFCFSVIPDAKLEAEYISKYIINELGLKRIAIVYRNDQSGINFSKFFKSYAESNGGEIVSNIAHEPNTSDFRTIISKIKDSKCDAVFLGSFGNETANFAKQSIEISFKKPLFTYETVNQPSAIDIGGNSLNNVQFVSPNIDFQSESVQTFKNSVVKEFSLNDLNYYMLSHYDAFTLLFNSINEVGISPVDIKKQLEKTKNYNGIGPKFSFNEKGGAVADIVILGFNNKKVHTVYE